MIDMCKELRAIEVTYEDGTVITTSMAAGLTDKQMTDYFRPGRVFNIDSVEDRMVTVKSNKIIR